MDFAAEAQRIKSIRNTWGGQDGLLSIAELAHLMALVAAEPGPLRVLEVGHYHGLSTCGIVTALAHRDDWQMLTVDSHEADQWVGQTSPSDFERNRLAHFDSPRLTPLFVRSQQYAVSAPLDHEFIFYDGTHATEQVRFTRIVSESPSVRTFVFDDRDFQFPAECCDMLRAAGWRDESPSLARLGDDKRNPETMTLGVFRRGLS